MIPSAALLPSGFYDLLPPHAAFEAELVYRAMQGFMRYGYERVAPPLVEFEDSLLANASPSMDRQTFRVMDPLSQKTMGIRADMTMQIGRIAINRMKDAPRPLRLCYSGTTLHTKADSLTPARQHTQAGAELIGAHSVASDAESIIVASHSLQLLGVKRIAVDINLPSLVALALDEYGLARQEAEDILHAVANKDVAAIRTSSPHLRDWLGMICRLYGPAEDVLNEIMQASFWPESGEPVRQRLKQLITQLTTRLDGVHLSIDLTENRGFDYDNTGVSFALFATGIQGEIGRGGRYLVAADGKTPATGFTIYLTRLLQILPLMPEKQRIYVPYPATTDQLAALHAKGYATISSLEDAPSSMDHLAEAKRLACQFLLKDGVAVATSEGK